MRAEVRARAEALRREAEAVRRRSRGTVAQQRDRLRGELPRPEALAAGAEALLLALGEPGTPVFVPTPDPAACARILGRAAERVLRDLQAMSPQAIRAALQKTVKETLVQPDGKVVVEGTWEELVWSATGDSPAGGQLGRLGKGVRTMLLKEGVERSWGQGSGFQETWPGKYQALKMKPG